MANKKNEKKSPPPRDSIHPDIAMIMGAIIASRYSKNAREAMQRSMEYAEIMKKGG